MMGFINTHALQCYKNRRDGRLTWLAWPLGLSIACQWQSAIVLIPGGLCFARNVSKATTLIVKERCGFGLLLTGTERFRTRSE